MLRTLASRATRARGLTARLIGSVESSSSRLGNIPACAFTTSALRSVGLPIPEGPHGINYHHPSQDGGYGFFMPRHSLLGPGSLKSVGGVVKAMGLTKALIVTDEGMAKSGATKPVTDMLAENGIEAVIFSGAMPNPTDTNVEDGLKIMRDANCDFLISYGGGSSHDCAKAMSVVATNGGRIHDYQGLNSFQKALMPLVAINTTAGTASEMTRFCVITDTSTNIKMVIADTLITPTIAVDDPTLMVKKPKGLTAATGMDAMTHAVEAYLSIISNPVTDASALHAIKLIAAYLPTAVNDGANIQARDMMAYAQFLAGMAFNSAFLGNVHALAHQIGTTYNLPHGVCNAMMLPSVLEFNASAVPERYIDIGEAMGLGTLSKEEAPAAVVAAVRELSANIGIPKNLQVLGVKPEDFSKMADQAFNDVCRTTNPKPSDKNDLINLYRAAYEQNS